jgi:membrane protease YdiL (CAAX protease family)
MKRWIERHDTVAFLVVTFGISWPLWFASGALTRTPIRIPDISWLVAQIGVFAPAFAGMAIGACLEPGGGRRALRTLAFVYAPAAALGLWIATRGFSSFFALGARLSWGMIGLSIWVLVWFSAGRNRLFRWPGEPAGRMQTALWSMAGLLVPAALFLAAWSATGGAIGRAGTIPPMPVRDLSPFGLLAAFAMNLAYGGSLGEEPGWRGAWLPRLLQRHPPFVASLIISFWWALWHAPIDLSQGFGLTGLGGLVIRQLWTYPVAVIITWATLRAGGSILPAIMVHTTLNAIPDFVLSQPARYESATSLFLLLIVVVVVVAAFTDARLRNGPRRS